MTGTHAYALPINSAPPPPSSLTPSAAREFSGDFSGGPIFDVVLTVPSYATQNERLALVDAAELAGLKVRT